MRLPFFVALFLYTSKAVPEERESVFDLEDATRKTANRLARENGVDYEWFDLYCKHSQLQYNRYKIFKVYVTAGMMEFEKSEDQLSWPENAFEDSVVNMLGQASMRTIKISKEFQEEQSVRTTTGFRMGTSTSLQVGNPSVVSASASLSMGIRVNTNSETSKSQSKKVNVTMFIKVQPFTAIKVLWSTARRKKSVPWKASITIAGWFAMWYRTRVKGHYLWFVKVTELAKDNPGLTVLLRGQLSYTVRGTFKSISTVESKIFVREEDVESDEEPSREKSKLRPPVLD